MAKNPADVAKKWAQNLGGSQQAIRDGVGAVTTAPTQQAAAAKDRYVLGVQAAAANGKWERGLQRVSLQDWKTAMLEKGLARVGPGANAAQGKMTAFMQRLLPYQEQLKGQLASMPRGDLSANIQRMIAWAQGMADFPERS